MIRTYTSYSHRKFGASDARVKYSNGWMKVHYVSHCWRCRSKKPANTYRYRFQIGCEKYTYIKFKAGKLSPSLTTDCRSTCLTPSLKHFWYGEFPNRKKVLNIINCLQNTDNVHQYCGHVNCVHGYEGIILILFFSPILPFLIVGPTIDRTNRGKWRRIRARNGTISTRILFMILPTFAHVSSFISLVVNLQSSIQGLHMFTCCHMGYQMEMGSFFFRYAILCDFAILSIYYDIVFL